MESPSPTLIGDNLAVGAAIVIICRLPRLSLNALLRIGIATIGISAAASLTLTNSGHALHTGLLGASVLATLSRLYFEDPIKRLREKIPAASYAIFKL